MIYQNNKTGALVETDAIVSGGDWVAETIQERNTSEEKLPEVEEKQKAAAQTKRR